MSWANWIQKIQDKEQSKAQGHMGYTVNSGKDDTNDNIIWL